MNRIVYRCGWCGSFTKATGENLYGEDFEKAGRILTQYNNVRVKLVNGWCCKHQADW